MASMTIKELILKKVGENKFVIPAIQRKYVWNEKDICKYFDSIMREYPTGHIMLWSITGKYINSKQITFYKFLDDFVENSQDYNKPVPHVAEGDYYAVLDGQQRIQSLIIALNGKYTNKSGAKKELYINLLKKNHNKEEFDAFDEDNDDEYYQGEYEFKFFKEQDINELKDVYKNEGLWFKVKRIIEVDNSSDISKIINDYKEMFNDGNNKYNIKLNDEQIDSARDKLNELFQRINKDTDVLIIDDLKKDFSLSQILEIFVRVNSGGEKLSKPDLLFSTVVSKWDKGREKIEEFIKEINKPDTYLSFRFDSDFIMRTFLFIKGNDTAMKIENFGVIADGIEKDWENISKAIRKVVRYIRNEGFKHEFITSYNSIIPLVYYAYNNTKKIPQTDVNEMVKYLYVSQLNHLFGTASNQALNQCKQVLNNKNEFKLSDFYNITLTSGSSFKITKEDIEKWLAYKKDSKESSIVLRALYDEINYGSDAFQKDHAHPEVLIKKYVEEHPECDYLEKYNCIPNLEILRTHDNVVNKNEMPLKDWVKLDKNNKVKYTDKNTSLEIEDFDEFFECRKTKMTNKLCEVFNIKYEKDNN